MILRRGSRHFFDFNPRPPRGGRLNDSVKVIDNRTISIHAPREGGDEADFYSMNSARRISIHAPREGGDHFLLRAAIAELISIHAPREGGDK